MKFTVTFKYCNVGAISSYIIESKIRQTLNPLSKVKDTFHSSLKENTAHLFSTNMGYGMGSGWRMGAHARGKTERIAVPAMPMPLAVICCVLNFLVPGLGTILAGFSVFCCSRNEDMACYTRCGSCCISLGIGLLQLLTLPLLLLGWIWSCIWGVSFLGMSAEYYHDNPLSGGTVMPNRSNAAHPQGIVIIQQQPQVQGYGQRQQSGQPYCLYGPAIVPQPPPYQGPSNVTPTAPPIGEGQSYPNEPPPPYDYYPPSDKQ